MATEQVGNQAPVRERPGKDDVPPTFVQRGTGVCACGGGPPLPATCSYLVAVAGRASAWEFKVVISGERAIAVVGAALRGI